MFNSDFFKKLLEDSYKTGNSDCGPRDWFNSTVYGQTLGVNDQHAVPLTFSSRKQWEDIIWSRLDLISAWLADAVSRHSSRRASRLAVSCSSTKV